MALWWAYDISRSDWPFQTGREIQKALAPSDVFLAKRTESIKSRFLAFRVLVMDSFTDSPPCHYVVIKRNGMDGKRMQLELNSESVFGRYALIVCTLLIVDSVNFIIHI